MGKRSVFKKLPLSICIFICLLVLPGVNSCSQDTIINYTPIEYTGGENYRTFVAENDIPQFSFEYPSKYELNSYQASLGIFGSSIILTGPPEEEEKGNIKHLEITISYVNTDLETELNWRINDLQSSVDKGIIGDLITKEKRYVLVAGIEGWELLFSFTVVNSSSGNPGIPNPFFAVSRYVYLEYQNAVYEISLFSDSATEKQSKSDFEHILKTFKILD